MLSHSEWHRCKISLVLGRMVYQICYFNLDKHALRMEVELYVVGNSTEIIFNSVSLSSAGVVFCCWSQKDSLRVTATALFAHGGRWLEGTIIPQRTGPIWKPTGANLGRTCHNYQCHTHVIIYEHLKFTYLWYAGLPTSV